MSADGVWAFVFLIRFNLEDMAKNLRGGQMNGEDLVKVRDYLDQVEKLANKYGEDTGPYTNFLKGLRGSADATLDRAAPEVDAANQAFAQFKSDTGLLRSATNEGQAEKMINNLYGANKGAQQDAASRLFSPDTLEQAKDISANKAIANAKGPAGSEFGIRKMGGLILGSGTGTAVGGPLGGFAGAAIGNAVTSPTTWATGLRALGTTEQKIGYMLDKAPEYLGKYAPVLQQASVRGPSALASTHFLLQQNDPQYRQLINNMGNGQ